MEELELQLKNTQQEIEEFITKGFDNESDEKIKELFEKQMHILQKLNIKRDDHRELIEQTIEKNKQLIKKIEEKQQEVLEQVGKMSDTQDNKKNYDLYK